MRIHKYISQCGVCSRREAERKIEEGSVTVNGELAKIGQEIDESKDKVCVDGVLLRGITQKKVVLAMNKPKGFLCTNDDPFGGDTVFDLLPSPYAEMKLFCCGRLDKDSQGLLVLTNDGDFANKISHPSSGVTKRYFVTLNRPLDEEVAKTLERGVVCDGEKLRANKILPDPNSHRSGFGKKVEVRLSQGRKREIRRMFRVMGYFVKELVRVQIGSYELRRIPEGGFRELGEGEIARLLKNPSAK